MSEERRDTDRNKGFARAGIVPSLYGYVADVSPRGFRAVFSENPCLAEGQALDPVLSFSEIGVEPFSLPVDVRWTREKDGAWEVGFSVHLPMPEGPVERDFLRIHEYYLNSFR